MESAKWRTGLPVAAMAAVVVAFWTPLASGETETVDGVEWTYYINANGEVILGNPNPARGDLTIPPTLGGAPVTELSNHQFYQCTDVTSLTVPDSVRNIGQYAFKGCTGLTNAVIGAGVTNIGFQAFDQCRKLETVTFRGEPPTLQSVFFQNGDPDRVYAPASWEGTGALDGEVEEWKVVYGPMEVAEIAGVRWEYTMNMAGATVWKGAVAGDLQFPLLGGRPVGKIGTAAFNNCKGLTSVSIPASMREIGVDAFHGCTGLTNLAFSEGLEKIGDGAFGSCNNAALTNLSLPGSVRIIGEAAFCNCEHILRLEMGSGVERIGKEAFANCTELTGLVIPPGVKSVGKDPFAGCPVSNFSMNLIPGVKILDGWALEGDPSLSGNLELKGLRGIAEWAFRDCRELTGVTICDGVPGIGDGTFYGCSGLSSVALPGSVKSIGARAFQECISLGSLPVPDGVERIGEKAFMYCRGLTNAAIGEGVASIGDDAFRDCTGLATVAIGRGVERIGDGAFYGCTNLADVHIRDLVAWCGIAFQGSSANPLYNARRLFLDGMEVRELVIPDGVARIGDHAFVYWPRLAGLVLPDSVVEVGRDAFAGCTGVVSVAMGNGVADLSNLPLGKALADITIGDGVRNLPDSLFREYTNLESVAIGNGVTNIGWRAFYKCTNLASLAIGEGVRTIGGSAFTDCSKLVALDIPDSAEEVGQSAFSGCGSLARLEVPGVWYGTQMLRVAGVPSGCEVVYRGLETETVDGVTWTYAVKGGTATLLPGGYAGEVAIPGKLGGCPVVAIGEKAFSGCTNLVSVAIPDSVARIGAHAFDGCRGLTTLSLPEGLEKIGEYGFSGCMGLTAVAIPDRVSEIGYFAFYGCSGLTDVEMGRGVETIGYQAFGYCSGLTTIFIPDGVSSIGRPAFYGCGKLEEIEVGAGNANYESMDGSLFDKGRTVLVWVPEGKSGIYAVPDGVADIGAAFQNCRLLTGVAIPGSVSGLLSDAFDHCDALRWVCAPADWEGKDMVPGNVPVVYGEMETETGSDGRIWTYAANAGEATVLGVRPTDGALVIPGTLGGAAVTGIGPAFSGCTDLTGAAIPDGLARIMEEAFRGCTGLEEVAIPDGVVELGESAFEDCRGLRNAVLGGGVSNIASWTFANCREMTNVVLGGGVTNIEEHAFDGCVKLAAVDIPDGVRSIGDHAFEDCRALRNVVVAEGVGNIGRWAFAGCEEMTNVVVGGNVTNIAEYAFLGCVKLAAVAVPDGVQSIGDSAFAACGSLASIEIGTGVTAIGRQAFADCTGLATLTIPPNVGSVGSGAFEGCAGLATLYVPASWFGTVKLRDAGVPEECTVVYGMPRIETLDGVEWRYVVRDGRATVIAGDYAGDLAVPATLGGCPVTGIGDRAFAGCGRLTSLIIGGGVESVGKQAFADCAALVRLDVPGEWYGSDVLANAGVPEGCAVVCRGVEALEVATVDLPPGKAGKSYEAAIAASGGVGPYTWREKPKTEYSEMGQANTFTARGTAQGWKADDGCWNLALPFAFPYFGKTYANAKINSNGAISFGNGSFTAYAHDEATFKALPVIAPLWTDLNTSYGDVYVESGTEAVTVRWAGIYYSGGEVNFSATLCRDGRIVLSYGEGNGSGGFIGISAGDGVTTLVSAKNGRAMFNADDIVLTAPKGLPDGMELTADGVLRGTPGEAGRFVVTVVVTDAKGVSAEKELTLAVAGGGGGDATETTPVPVPQEWLEENAATILAENGGDWEAAANAKAANGRPVWECYLAGLAPADAAAEFKVKSISFVDGKPVVKWEPDLNEDGTASRLYRVWARSSLEAPEPEEPGATKDGWRDVTGQEPTWVTNGWRFFRVDVELPK